MYGQGGAHAPPFIPGIPVVIMVYISMQHIRAVCAVQSYVQQYVVGC